MLNKDAVMTFADYEPADTGIRLHFICYYPGPGMPTDYYITVSDEELKRVLEDRSKFEAFVQEKLKRKFRGIDALDKYINMTVVV